MIEMGKVEFDFSLNAGFQKCEKSCFQGRSISSKHRVRTIYLFLFLVLLSLRVTVDEDHIQTCVPCVMMYTTVPYSNIPQFD